LKPIKADCIERILDANINRLKEGLRVSEEVSRFILENRALTLEFKKIRHSIDIAIKQLPDRAKLLNHRNSLTDVGSRVSLKSEFQRSDFRDIFFANIQRVKESLRVLEEFSKLKSLGAALEFKKLRYKAYALEKRIAKKFPALCHNR
jgi:thiamine-phosphate pyrophosphorylase